MADTPTTSTGTDLSSILGIINAAVNLGKGSGSTPNFYTAPLTPGEEWVQGAKKNLFDYASAYTDQYLRGLGNLNPNYTLPSPLVGNQAFMGGIKVPTIDWSKMPSRPNSTGSGATTPVASGVPTNIGDPSAGIPSVGG